MTEPMYRLIALDLQQQIESGELPPGAQLKTETELRTDYGQTEMVSRNTVRSAIKLLAIRGLVETRPGLGTFVTKRIQPFISKLTANPEAGVVEDMVYVSEVERRGRIPDLTRPRVEVHPASDLVATQLGLAGDAHVISRHQDRSIDGIPWSRQTTFYPMDLLQRGEAAARLLQAPGIPNGVIAYLRRRLQIDQVGWRDTIMARPPSKEERAFFGLSDNVQVIMFEFRRVGFDQNGRPIRLTVTIYPADRNRFEMEAGRVPGAPASPKVTGQPAST